MEQVASVTKAPPKAYEESLKAWQSGNANKSLSLLKPLVESFRGLPVEWAERASALLVQAGGVPQAAGPVTRACRSRTVRR